ncbi:MFS transporter [Granulicella sibirica]|uniref:Putative transporter n=1 Tax=Granulicella sibirica TaxID=2479048 RepID=A0A4Q0T173_9BACT|nr:MFS transporter [Granulicella sibirica]RXH55156.1 putative transporter [Granulicella sibirica]
MPLETPDTAPPTEGLNPAPASTSGLAPLSIPLFRDRWIASTISNLGTWMQDTAGTWLMTSLTASPLLIALMQTAASLPIFFLGLLAGATADIFDRRKLLIFWQTWMLVSVALLAVFTFLGHISPWALLAFTFLLNVGSAMNNPAWQAIVPELVPRALIPDTVTLNAASNNIARAVGPAIGGLMVAAFKSPHAGAGWVFFLNAASFAGVIWVLVNWKRMPLFKSALPSERIAGSIRSGLRYIRYSPPLQASLLRVFLFTFFVSAVWSLLALVAKRDLHQGALGYGILNGALGVGALIGASTLPRVRRKVPADTIITFATVAYVVTLLILAFVKSPPIVIGILVVAGYAWTSTMSTLNVSVQLSVPAWVQARALGAYLMTFQGGLALGSILWGFVAEHTSTPTALVASSIGLTLSLPIALRFHILRGAMPDLTPYQWKNPPPILAHFDGVPDEQPTAGPVRISVEYVIPIAHYAEFTRIIHQFRDVRLRDGAIRWGIFRDAQNPELLNETFVMESWLDYLRSRERLTTADMAIRDRLRAMHSLDQPPHITHQLYAREVPLDAPQTTH